LQLNQYIRRYRSDRPLSAPGRLSGGTTGAPAWAVARRQPLGHPPTPQLRGQGSRHPL